MYVRKIVIIIIIIIIKAESSGYPVNPQFSSGFWCFFFSSCCVPQTTKSKQRQKVQSWFYRFLSGFWLKVSLFHIQEEGFMLNFIKIYMNFMTTKKRKFAQKRNFCTTANKLKGLENVSFFLSKTFCCIVLRFGFQGLKGLIAALISGSFLFCILVALFRNK